MRLPMRPSSPRPGFTLVELLVVISIIVILIALLLVAVTGVINRGDEATTLNDIRQLAISVNNFKQKFGVLPPSKITLSGNGGLLLNNDPTSYAYLNAIWPRLDWTGASGVLDWAGLGPSHANPNAIYTLEGDACLVFFLGGIPFHDPNDPANPQEVGCLGFSANPKNPTTQPIASETRISFYQFDKSRLFARSPAAAPFYAFKDAWGTGQPYAFFSSGKRQNGYNAAPGDCPSLIPNGPYCDAVMVPGVPPSVRAITPLHYVNPTSFQIISAGKNGLFGPGGPWSPATANLIGTTANVGGTMVQTGIDDQANFYDAKLGVPQ